MASEWFMRRNGEEDGPFSSEQLKQMARNGLLAAEDLVWKEGMDEWRPAGESRRLFPKSGRGQKKRTSGSSQTKLPEADIRAVVPAGKSMLPKLALPTDRRVRMALVGGGAVALLMLGMMGVVFTRFLGDSTAEDGQERIAAVGGNAPPGPENQAANPGERPLGLDVPVAADEEPLRLIEPLPPGVARIGVLDVPTIPGSAQALRPTALAMSSDNRYLAAGLEDGRLILFDVVEGKLPRIIERANPVADMSRPLNDATTSIAFSPSRSRVAWGTQSRNFAFADLADGAVVWRSPVILRRSASDLDPPQIVLKDDDTMVVSTSAGISELSSLDVCRPLHGGSPWHGMGPNDMMGEIGLTFVVHSGAGIAGRGPGRWPTKQPTAARLNAIFSDGRGAGLMVSGGAGSLTVVELGGDAIATRRTGVPLDLGKSPRMVMPNRDVAVLATSSQIVVFTGKEGLRAIDLPASDTPSAFGADLRNQRAVLGMSSGRVYLINLMEGDPGQSLIALPSSIGRPACAAISPDGARVAVSRGAVVDLLIVEAAGSVAAPGPAARE